MRYAKLFEHVGPLNHLSLRRLSFALLILVPIGEDIANPWAVR